MNVRTAITRKEQESDLPSSGGLCWASVHTYSNQHASSVKAAVAYAGTLVTAGRTGVLQWDSATGKYVHNNAKTFMHMNLHCATMLTYTVGVHLSPNLV